MAVVAGQLLAQELGLHRQQLRQHAPHPHGDHVEQVLLLLPSLRQLEAASSKWVVTDTAGRAKVEVALQKGVKPDFITEEGGQKLNHFTVGKNQSKLTRRE